MTEGNRMARRIEWQVPPVPDIADNGHHPGLREWESEIRVITPLFGGGTTPRETDPVTVVRPSSIRGHLRFWWRATRGAQFGTAAKLREREDALWGSVETPSQVIVEVSDINAGPLEVCTNPAYALFPFQPNPRKGILQARARPDVAFKLIVRHRDQDKGDVFAALWAWTNFGGIGARTRRGCGALMCKASAPKSTDLLPKWWAKGSTFLKAPPPGDQPEWARMQNAPMIKAEPTSPIAAWEASVGLMREFRQGADVGRNRGMGGRPGRSLWPEANSLRGITGKGEGSHEPGIHADAPGFPRAELGLPIVFHFHFEDPLDKPNNSELYPRRTPESHRMASPVILRPLGIWGTAQAVPMMLVLTAPPPQDLQLHFDDGTTSPMIGPQEVRRPDLATYPNSPMAGRSAAGSALEAFQAFAISKGYRRP